MKTRILLISLLLFLPGCVTILSGIASGLNVAYSVVQEYRVIKEEVPEIKEKMPEDIEKYKALKARLKKRNKKQRIECLRRVRSMGQYFEVCSLSKNSG